MENEQYGKMSDYVDRTRAILNQRGLQAQAAVNEDAILDAWQAMERQAANRSADDYIRPPVGSGKLVTYAASDAERIDALTAQCLVSANTSARQSARLEALLTSYEAVVNASAQRGVRITELEAENATLRAQLAGKVSISCADAAAVLTAMKTTLAIVPSTALAHRKPQIGLRTL